MQDGVLPAADWSMLPLLDRPKTLVDEQGRDLPALQQDHPKQRDPQDRCESSSGQRDGAMLLLSSIKDGRCLL